MRSFKLFTILALSSIMILSSCKSKSAKELIVAKWKVTAVSDDMVEADRKLTEQDKKDLIDKTTLEFSKDGKCTITSRDTPETGSYKVSEDGKTLTMTQSGSEHSDTMASSEINDSKLVIADGRSKMKISLAKQ